MVRVAAAQSRASGRGGVSDPDVIQAMPQPRPADPANRPDRMKLREQRESPFYVPAQLRPRVILRFASDEKNLLISGMLAGGNELANRPAIVDVPVGRGHVVMFATNPMWRHQTQGEFFLLFNAALNYDNLSVGRAGAVGHSVKLQARWTTISDGSDGNRNAGVGVADREAGDYA